MIAITLQNFENDLLQASLQQPVLLDIWAPWCGPCKALGPMLEKLEADYAGRFKLAKLNSDEQPEIAGQLSQAFGVRSIPFCVLFDQGQPVDGFVGAIPEGEIRKFLDRHLPGADELAAAGEAEAAEALLAEGDTDAALARLQEAVAGGRVVAELQSGAGRHLVSSICAGQAAATVRPCRVRRRSMHRIGSTAHAPASPRIQRTGPGMPLGARPSWPPRLPTRRAR